MEKRSGRLVVRHVEYSTLHKYMQVAYADVALFSEITKVEQRRMTVEKW